MRHLPSGESPQQPTPSSGDLKEQRLDHHDAPAPLKTEPATTPRTLSSQEEDFAARMARLQLKRKRMLKRQARQDWLRALTFSLAILLILCGLGFITYTTSIDYRQSSHTFATVQAQWTQNVVNTAQARTQSTANAINTVQANINATATAQTESQASATMTTEDTTATATTLESLLSETTQKTANLDDPLTDRDGGGKWDIGGDMTTGCAFTSSGYHAFVAKRGYIQPCLSQAKTYADTVYSAQVTINTGNGNRAGLVFRVNTSGDQYYFFSIGTDGTYGLDLYQGNGQGKNLLSGRDTTNTIAVGLAQSNQLTVLAQGDTFYLFANNTFLAGTQDGTLKSGRLGVAVVQADTPIDATFSDAQVWKL